MLLLQLAFAGCVYEPIRWWELALLGLAVFPLLLLMPQEEFAHDIPLFRDRGRAAAKVMIQNVGTNPIIISESGDYPQDGLYHPPVLAAGSANDDGTGGFAQWDDFRNGIIKITSIAGAWRAAVKIIWRETPFN